MPPPKMASENSAGKLENRGIQTSLDDSVMSLSHDMKNNIKHNKPENNKTSDQVTQTGLVEVSSISNGKDGEKLQSKTTPKTSEASAQTSSDNKTVLPPSATKIETKQNIPDGNFLNTHMSTQTGPFEEVSSKGYGKKYKVNETESEMVPDTSMIGVMVDFNMPEGLLDTFLSAPFAIYEVTNQQTSSKTFYPIGENTRTGFLTDNLPNQKQYGQKIKSDATSQTSKAEIVSEKNLQVGSEDTLSLDSESDVGKSEDEGLKKFQIDIRSQSESGKVILSEPIYEIKLDTPVLPSEKSRSSGSKFPPDAPTTEVSSKSSSTERDKQLLGFEPSKKSTMDQSTSTSSFISLMTAKVGKASGISSVQQNKEAMPAQPSSEGRDTDKAISMSSSPKESDASLKRRTPGSIPVVSRETQASSLKKLPTKGKKPPLRPMKSRPRSREKAHSPLGRIEEKPVSNVKHVSQVPQVKHSPQYILIGQPTSDQGPFQLYTCTPSCLGAVPVDAQKLPQPSTSFASSQVQAAHVYTFQQSYHPQFAHFQSVTSIPPNTYNPITASHICHPLPANGVPMQTGFVPCHAMPISLAPARQEENRSKNTGHHQPLYFLVPANQHQSGSTDVQTPPSQTTYQMHYNGNSEPVLRQGNERFDQPKYTSPNQPQPILVFASQHQSDATGIQSSPIQTTYQMHYSRNPEPMIFRQDNERSDEPKGTSSNDPQFFFLPGHHHRPDFTDGQTSPLQTTYQAHYNGNPEPSVRQGDEIFDQPKNMSSS